MPDAELLIRLAEELDTTVSQLLDKTAEPAEPTQLEVIAEKLEVLNRQFAAQEAHRRTVRRLCFGALGILALVILGAQLLSCWYASLVVHRLGSTAAVIGGGDVPTELFLVSDPTGGPWLLLGLLSALIAAVGLYKTRR